MPKRIEFEGALHEFPDDFTDGDIASALSSLAPAKAPEAPKAPEPGIASKAWDVANTHAVQALGGGTALQAYEGAGEGLKEIASRALGTPYSKIREDFPIVKAAEFVGDAGKLIPKAIDALYTPIGAAATVLPFLRAPKVAAAVGAAFSTQQAMDLPNAVERVKRGEMGAGELVADTAMTALPLVGPLASRMVRKRSQTRVAEPPRVDDPKPAERVAEPANFLEPAENYPTPFKSAEESAQVFKGLPFVKSAEESAKVFDNVLAQREAQAPPRAERRASILPEDTASVPEEVLRAQDRRQSMARDVFQKPWEELSNPERLLIDEEITKPPAGRESPAFPPPIKATRRRDNQRGSLPLPSRKEISDATLETRTDLADRYAPIEQIEKAVPSLPFEQSAYKGARSYGGVRGVVANRLDDLASIVRPAEKSGILKDAADYMTLERHEELFGRLPEYEAPGGMTLADVQAQKAAMESAFGPKKLADVQKVAADVRKYSDGLLQYMRDKGVLSEASLQKIRQDNEKYIPFNRLEMIAEELDKSLPTGGDAFSVASSSLRGIKGSSKEIANPIESLVRNTGRYIHEAERNDIARKLAAHANRPEFKGVVMELKPGQRPAEGFERLSYLDDGIKREYAVPEGVATAMKGLSQDQADIITRSMASWARMLRAGVTLDPTFMARNVVRDFSTTTAASRLPGIGFTPADWAYGFVSALTRGIPSHVVPAPLKRVGVGDQTYRAFRESKGAFGGFYHGQSPQRTASDLTAGPGRRVLNKVTSVRGLGDAMDLLASPMQTIGETLELAPRLGVFNKAQKVGLSQGEAGWKARNASVDFERRGRAMKAISMAIPFLNANIQGRLNMLNAVREAPLATSMRLAAVAGIPALAAYAVGRMYFPEEYDSLARFEKDQHMIFIYGKGRDAEGNLTEALAIPKGDTGPMMNAAEEMLEAFRKKEPVKWKALMQQTLSDLSPVPFAREGKLSATAVASTVLPPPLKAIGEAAYNVNAYTGRDIVPDYIHGVPSRDISPKNRYTANTAPFMVKAAEALDKVGIEASPMTLANAAGTLGGYYGRRFAKPETATNIFVRGFKGAKTDSTSKELMDAAQREARSYADKNVEISRVAESITEQAFKLPAGQRSAFVSQKLQAEGERLKGVLGGEDVTETLAEELIDSAERRAAGVTREERTLLRLNAKPRAKVLLETVKAMSPDKRSEALRRWQDIKVLTPKVEQEIEALLPAN